MRCPRKAIHSQVAKGIFLSCEVFLAMAADMVRIWMEFWATKERFRIMEEARGVNVWWVQMSKRSFNLQTFTTQVARFPNFHSELFKGTNSYNG